MYRKKITDGAMSRRLWKGRREKKRSVYIIRVVVLVSKVKT